MFKIFVSYSNEDLPSVRNLTEVIKYPGVDIFVAEDRVKAGDSLWSNILSNIDDAQIVLVFVSKHSSISSSVNNEIGYALKAKKNIIPVVIEKGVEPPSIIAHLKYVDFTNDRDKSIAELQEAIKQSLVEKLLPIQKVESNKEVENFQTLIIVIVLIIIIVWALKNAEK